MSTVSWYLLAQSWANWETPANMLLACLQKSIQRRRFAPQSSVYTCTISAEANQRLARRGLPPGSWISVFPSVTNQCPSCCTISVIGFMFVICFDIRLDAPSSKAITLDGRIGLEQGLDFFLTHETTSSLDVSVASILTAECGCIERTLTRNTDRDLVLVFVRQEISDADVEIRKTV